MKSTSAFALILTAALTLSLGDGCSTKEEPPQIQEPKVVVRFKMPPRKRPPVPKETSAEQEKMAPSVPQTKTAEVSMPASPLPVKEPKDTANVEKGEGFYRVHKGDSLFKIAGLKDIYGDPIKWPSLFRLNMDRLDNIQADDDLEHKELPEGLSLRFVTPHEASDNLSALGHKSWVVNAVSEPDMKKIVTQAVTLMKSGYHVYMVRAKVEGREWMRLRIGFYANRQDAARVGKEIMPMINAPTAWVTKIDQAELEKFGGY